MTSMRLKFTNMPAKAIEKYIEVASTALTQARKREKDVLKKQLAALAVKHGYALDDILTDRVRIGKKSAARYANKSDKSQTWSGRGRHPAWLVAKLKKGGDAEDHIVAL